LQLGFTKHRQDARALPEEKRGIFASNYLGRTGWALLEARDGHRAEALVAMDAETLKFARGCRAQR
jgi:hypothetical protein